MRTTILLLFCILFSVGCLDAQINVIEVDSISGALKNVVPFNKPFQIKLKLQQNNTEIGYVMIVKKYRYKDLSGSLLKYPIPTVLPNQYYQIKKLGTSCFLLISLADTFLLKPSTSYFFIVGYKKVNESFFSFFDDYYFYSKEKDEKKKTKYFENACSKLDDFNKSNSLTFGNVSLGGLTTKEFINYKEDIAKSFDSLLMKSFSRLDLLSTNTNSFLKRQNNLIPDLSGVLAFLVNRDTTVTDQAFNYIGGKDYSKVSQVADLMTLGKINKTNQLVSGVINLDSIYNKPIDNTSKRLDDFKKRVSNIEKAINLLNSVQRSIYLLNSKLKMDDKGVALQTFIDTLMESKCQLDSLIKIRKKIDATLLDSYFLIHKNKGKKDTIPTYLTKFYQASLINGNSYLDFETRNKTLLTPDFGIVTSYFFSQGKNLDYGIVPYLGFHLNFMAVDKDLSFSSYRKDWKQRFSVMVGWSLVSMKNKDSTYTNFFSKSSLLTGVGFRLNNVIRITTGAQWLFKTKDIHNNRTRILQPFAFVGISFDFNIKQYLNGFTDILSGIGKTKSASTSQ